MRAPQWFCISLVVLLNAVVASGDESTFAITLPSGKLKSYSCLPQTHQDKSTAAFNKGWVDFTLVRTDTYECEKTKEGDDNDRNLPVGSVYRDLFGWIIEDMDKVNGTVAVVQGSKCDFALFSYYMYDFETKIHNLREAGALGVIFAEGKPGKLPQIMSTTPTDQTLPVCILDYAGYEELAVDFGDTNQLVVDTSKTIMYRMVDEPIPNPVLTSLFFHEQWSPSSPDGLNFGVPALTATFNPDTMDAFTGVLVKAELIEACWSEEFNGCIQCWDNGTPFLNANDLVGKVAFFQFNAAPPQCFPYYFQWAQLAEQAGARGVVFGTSEDHFYHVPGMYLSGVTIPFFSIMHLHSQTIEEMIEQSFRTDGVEVKLPELIGRSGPPYFATEDRDMGLVVIGAWKDYENNQGDDEKTQFHCTAGQATYNPLEFEGIKFPDFANQIGLDEGRVSEATPTDSCMSRDTCAKCLTSNIHVEQPEGNNPSPVVIMYEEKFPCYHSYMQFTLAANYVGATGLLVVNSDPIFAYTMGASGTYSAYRAELPTFNVPSSCGQRLTERVPVPAPLEAKHSVHVHLPVISNGTAVLDEMTENYMGYVEEENELEETTISLKMDLKMHEVHDLILNQTWLDAPCPYMKCQVGQAAYNPYTMRSVEAQVLPISIHSDCSFQATCVECDARENKYFKYGTEVPASDMLVKDKIVLIKIEQGFCLLPLSNMLYHMQEMGAAAMLIVNSKDETRTLEQIGIPFDLKIPIFNMMLSQGTSVLNYAMNDKIWVRTPRIEHGVAMVEGVFDVELSENNQIIEPDPGEVDPVTVEVKGGSDDAAMIIGVVVGILLICVICCGGYWFKKRQSLFAYNQFDMGVQTGDAFLDIGSVDALCGDEDDMMSSRQVNEHDRVAVFDISQETEE